jgi:hypothetical protein
LKLNYFFSKKMNLNIYYLKLKICYFEMEISYPFLGWDIIAIIIRFLPSRTKLILLRTCKKFQEIIFKDYSDCYFAKDILLYGHHLQASKTNFQLFSATYLFDQLENAFWGGYRSMIKLLLNELEKRKLTNPDEEFHAKVNFLRGCMCNDLRILQHKSVKYIHGFYISVMFGRYKTAYYLLKQMIWLVNIKWDLVLSLACRNDNSINFIKFLVLTKGASNVNWGLSAACKANKLENVKLMLTYGCSNLESVLRLAYREGNSEIIDYLKLYQKNKLT